MAGEEVKALYGLTRSAVEAREQLKLSVRHGLTQQYHRTLRTHPELLIADGLLSVRRQLGDLIAERRRVEGNQLQSEQVDAAIDAVSSGTLAWATDFLRGKRD